MNKQEQQVSIDDVRSFISGIEEDMARGWTAEAFALKLARIALASLTAELSHDERAQFEQFMAWRFGDVVDRRRAKNGDQEYMAWDMVVAWEAWQRKALPDYLKTPPAPDLAALVPDEFYAAEQNDKGMFELSEDCMCKLAELLGLNGIDTAPQQYEALAKGNQC